MRARIPDCQMQIAINKRGVSHSMAAKSGAMEKASDLQSRHFPLMVCF